MLPRQRSITLWKRHPTNWDRRPLGTRHHGGLDELLDCHGTTLRDEPGIGTIAAATLVCEVGDPHRFDRESKFARWCGTGAVALSSGEGTADPVKHRLDFRGNRRINSVLHIASVTQARQQPQAAAYLTRKTTEGKT